MAPRSAPPTQLSLSSDSWVNTTSGVGGPRDKSAGFRFQSEHLSFLWNDFELEELYEEDDMAARIVDEPTTEAMRRGWITRLPATDSQILGRINDKCDQLEVSRSVLEARRWSRLYGRSAIFVGADDGGKPSHPLFRQNIKNVYFLHSFAREELVPHKWQSDPFAPGFGKPLLYRVNSNTPGAGGGGTQIVHASRLILFDGVSTTRRKRIERNGAGASVLVRVLRVLAQFNGAFAQSLAQLADSHQNIYKLKNLAQLLLSPGGKAVIEERIKAIDETRSALNALVLDADNDSFDTRSLGSLTGTADLLEKFLLRLAAAADRPVTKLFGQSPAGMNATGESDQAIWNAKIESERVDALQPAIEEILRLVFAAEQGPTGGREPDTWSVEWPKLWELSEKEQSEIDNVNSQTDQAYFDLGILRPSHIAKARFGDQNQRPALSAKDIAALEAAEQPPIQDPSLTAPTQDEEDTTAQDLAAQMTDLQIERCAHGRPNRCPLCQVERLREPAIDPVTGQTVWPIKWRPIGRPKTLPAAGAAAPPGGTQQLLA